MAKSTRNLMAQSPINKPLKAFFEPKTLSELDLNGHILIPAIRYESTSVTKGGFQAYLSYLPKINCKPSPLDLDLACILLDQNNRELSRVHYGKIRTDDGSVRHGGDALIGAKTLEEKLINQEQINLHLDKLNKNVHHILIILSSYQHHCLTRATKGFGVLRDSNGVLAHEFALASLDKDTHAIIAWHLKKENDDWLVHAPLHPIQHGKITKILDSAIEFMSVGSTRW